jgi:hypothetical protein
VQPVAAHAIPLANWTFADVHAAPQAPQFVVVLTLVSHPVLSPGARQWSYPSAHFQVHLLAAQVGVPFCVLQTFPHFPQFKTSPSKAMQYPPQQVPPTPHGMFSFVHVSTQLPLGLHFFPPPPSPHSASPEQATQRWVVVWHRWPFSQSVSVLQPTAH